MCCQGADRLGISTRFYRGLPLHSEEGLGVGLGFRILKDAISDVIWCDIWYSLNMLRLFFLRSGFSIQVSQDFHQMILEWLLWHKRCWTSWSRRRRRRSGRVWGCLASEASPSSVAQLKIPPSSEASRSSIGFCTRYYWRFTSGGDRFTDSVRMQGGHVEKGQRWQWFSLTVSKPTILRAQS